MIPVPGMPSRPLQYLRAIRESDLPTGARAVCWALASFANNTTGKAYPTVKTLAKAAGLSEAVVSKHTGLAEQRGYLYKDRRYNGSIVYTITVPVTDETVENLDETEQVEQPLEDTSPPAELAPRVDAYTTETLKREWDTPSFSPQPDPEYRSTWDEYYANRYGEKFDP